MLTLRSILCPIDFSEQSQNALRWAIALGVKHQSRLIVLNAVDPLLAQAARARYGLDLPKAETEPAVREFVQASLPKGASWAPNLMTEVGVGDAGDVILEAADREKADLIVMGTHGPSGVRKLFLGSTTERVLRHTRKPVLAVPGSDVPVSLHADAPRFRLKRILAATDFSEGSAGAVQWAADLARTFGVELVIVHAVAPVVVPTRWQPYIELADEERLAQARERLKQWLGDLPIKAQGDVVVAADRPAEAIASAAADKGAGLVVLGLFGERAAFAPRPGSIAYRVLCTSNVAVLVVASEQLSSVARS
jgi:nucleotide-binding universal stress UspA family protein